MVILLVGPKGAGKSTLREWLQAKGFVSVYMEALYEELDRNREHTVDKPSESLRDEVYEIAKERIVAASKEGDVVFDGTGSSFRFDNFYKALLEECSVCYLVFVDAKRDVAFARTQERDVAAHRPFDREYFDRIYDECAKRKTEADFVIENNGALEDFISSFGHWFMNILAGFKH